LRIVEAPAAQTLRASASPREPFIFVTPGLTRVWIHI
jgi:hypothetical protein